jgi:hypothetical protein
MLEPHTHGPRADRRADHSVSEESRPSLVRRRRHASLPTTLVVHSRSHAVRFRILTAPSAPLPTDVPVSVPYLAHRTCRKAMDCHGDETPDRNQR